MQRYSIFVTRMIPQPGLDLLKDLDVTVNTEDRPLTREEVIAGARGKDALLTMLTDRIDREVLDAAPALRIVANYAVGYNNIDIEAATGRKVAVTNTPGVLTDATADLAWALLMASSRRVVEGDRYCREGKFRCWGPMLLLGVDVAGRTLGIVGMGRIGQAVAMRARGFGMKVLYTSRTPLGPEKELELGATRVSLTELLDQSDYVSLHVPLTPETRYLIGRGELERMKPTAVLINTSRGPVVDEKALVEALRERRIFAAGLDVYEDEPEFQAGLLELDNVTLLPHVGSGTVETRTRMSVMAACSIVDYFAGRRPTHIVNPGALD